MKPYSRKFSTIWLIFLFIFGGFIPAFTLNLFNLKEKLEGNSDDTLESITEKERENIEDDIINTEEKDSEIERLINDEENAQDVYTTRLNDININKSQMDVDYSSIEDLTNEYLAGNITLETYLIKIRGKPIIYTSVYNNGTFERIIKFIEYIDTKPVNLTDAIEYEILHTENIKSYEIINVKNVKDYNKKNLAYEVAGNLQALSINKLISKDFSSYYKDFFDLFHNNLKTGQSVLTLKYELERPINNRNYVLSKVIYDKDNCQVLFDNFLSNSRRYQVKNKTIVIERNLSISNKATINLYVGVLYNPSFLGIPIPIVSYKFTYDIYCSIEAIPFYTSSLTPKDGSISLAIYFAHETEYSTLEAVHYLVAAIPFVGLAFAIWFAVVSEDARNSEKAGAVSFSTSSSRGDTISSINDWSYTTPGGYYNPYSGPYYRYATISKSSNTQDKGTVTISTTLSGSGLGASGLDSDSVTLEYVRILKVPELTYVIDRTAMTAGVNGNLKVTVKNKNSDTNSIKLKDLIIKVSLVLNPSKFDINSVGTKYATHKFTTISDSGEKSFTIIPILDEMGDARLKIEILGYKFFIDANPDVTITISSTSIQKTQDITNLPAIANIIIKDFTPIHQFQLISRSEPGYEFSLNIALENLGGIDAQLIEFYLYLKYPSSAYFDTYDTLTYDRIANITGSNIELFTYSTNLEIKGDYTFRFGIVYSFEVLGKTYTSLFIYNQNEDQDNCLILPDPYNNKDYNMVINLRSRPMINLEVDITDDSYTVVKIIAGNRAQFDNLSFSISYKAIGVKYENDGMNIFGWFTDAANIITDIASFATKSYGEGLKALITAITSFKRLGDEMKYNVADFLIRIGVGIIIRAIYTLYFSWGPYNINTPLGSFLGDLKGTYYAQSGGYEPSEVIDDEDLILKFKRDSPNIIDDFWLVYLARGFHRSQIYIDFDYTFSDKYGNVWTGSEVELKKEGQEVSNLDNVEVTVQLSVFMKDGFNVYYNCWVEFLTISATLVIEIVLSALGWLPGMQWTWAAVAMNLLMLALSVTIMGIIAAILYSDPDPNYTVIDEPIPYELEEIFTNSSDGGSHLKQIKLMSDLFGYLNASKTSLFRLYQAKLENNQTYTVLQSKALYKYTVEAERINNDLLYESLYNALLNYNRSLIDNKTANILIEKIKNEGITPEVENKIREISSGVNNDTFDVIEEEIYNMNSTQIISLLNRNHTMDEMYARYLIFNDRIHFLRDESLDGIVYARTEILEGSIRNATTQELNVPFNLNKTIINQLESENFTNIETLCQDLNESAWELFYKTNNTLYMKYADFALQTLYSLKFYISVRAIGYPNQIIIDENITPQTLNLEITNNGFINSTFGFEVESDFIGIFSISPDISSIQIFVEPLQIHELKIEFSISDNHILTPGEYPGKIRVYSLENPLKYDEIDFSIIIPIYNFNISSEAKSISVVPGETVKTNLNVKNLGNVYDIYELQIVSEIPISWIYTLNKIILPKGNDYDIPLVITPVRHYTTTPGTYLVEIFVKSIGNGSIIKSLLYSIEILPYYEYSSSSKIIDNKIKPGEEAIFNFNITNLGNTPETYNISLSVDDFIKNWTTSNLLSNNYEVISLQPGETFSKQILLITIDTYKLVSGIYENFLKIESITSSVDHEFLDFTIEILKSIRFSVKIDDIEEKVIPGEIAQYNLTIQNLGNIGEFFNYSIDFIGAESTWEIQLITEEDPELDLTGWVSLNPGENQTFKLEVFPPRIYTTTVGIYPFYFLVFSNSTPPINQTVSSVIEILNFYEMTVDFDISNYEVDPGEITILCLNINNFGNDNYTFSISLSSNVPNEWISIYTNTILLQPGETSEIQIEILPPKLYTTVPGIYNITLNVTLLENPETYQMIETEIKILEFYESIIHAIPEKIEAEIGDSIEFEFSITNLGNVLSEYSLHSFSWNVSIVSEWIKVLIPSITLNPGETGKLLINIDIPYFWQDMEPIHAIGDIMINKLNESEIVLVNVELIIEATPKNMIYFLINRISSLYNNINKATESCRKYVLLHFLSYSKHLLNRSLVSLERFYYNFSVLLDILSRSKLQFVSLIGEFCRFDKIFNQTFTNYVKNELWDCHDQISLLIGTTINIALNNKTGTDISLIQITHNSLFRILDFYDIKRCIYHSIYIRLFVIDNYYSFLYNYAILDKSTAFRCVLRKLDSRYNSFLHKLCIYRRFKLIPDQLYFDMLNKISEIQSDLMNLNL